MAKIGKLLYWFIQCTWGILQTILGLILFMFHIKDEHHFFHGAAVTTWKGKSSVSLGMFVFVTEEPFFAEKLMPEFTMQELCNMLLVHEYGHTIQSLILGPLYLILMGIPSTLWGFLPCFDKIRKEKSISYFVFFTEKWANYLGEKVTCQKSMGKLLI